MLKEKLVKIYHKELKKLFPEVYFPLKHSTDFNLFVAAFLSANTTDRQVNKVMEKLEKKLKEPEDYVKVSLKELEDIIRPVGLYKQKAKRLKEAAEIILKRHNGKVPERIKDLVALPGVGRKVANVVQQWLYKRQEGIIVDTHVARLSRWLGLSCSLNPEAIEKELMQILPKKLWRDFPMRLIYYGQKICPARPHEHFHCPLTSKLRVFFKGLNLAVMGFSFNPQKYGYKIFVDLLKHGYKVFPVNPKGGEFKKAKVYTSVKELVKEKGKIDLIISVVKPEISLQIIDEALSLGIISIWFQPGSADKKVFKKAKEKGVEYFNFCFMAANGLW